MSRLKQESGEGKLGSVFVFLRVRIPRAAPRRRDFSSFNYRRRRTTGEERLSILIFPPALLL